MKRMQMALALTLALGAGCADGRSDVAGPSGKAPPEGTSAALAPDLVATLGELGGLMPPTLDRIRAREGEPGSAAAVAALTRTRAAFVARVSAGDAVGAYEWESRLRLESAQRIAAELGKGPFDALAASATTARDRLQARLRDGSGEGAGPLQDRLRLTERLCDAAASAARAGRMPAAYDYAAQALETAAGWQGPPEWVAQFGKGEGDRLRLRDGSCDSDGDGVPDRDRQRSRDGSGPNG